MSPTDKITLTAALISTTISTIVSIIVMYLSSRKQEKDALHTELFHINNLAIEYFYFEQDSFCNSCDGNRDNERSLRYDNYCCIVFNFLEKLYKHYFGNRKSIENFVGVRELVIRHKTWWILQRANRDHVEGYPLRFIDFIDTYLQ
jgi:hypothetical protein